MHVRQEPMTSLHCWMALTLHQHLSTLSVLSVALVYVACANAAEALRGLLNEATSTV